MPMIIYCELLLACKQAYSLIFLNFAKKALQYTAHKVICSVWEIKGLQISNLPLPENIDRLYGWQELVQRDKKLISSHGLDP